MKKSLAVLSSVIVLAACGGANTVDLSRAHPVKGSSAIVGGTNDTGHHKVVLIYNSVEGFLCTGTVIGPSVVLTAGHCTVSETDGHTYSPNGYEIYDINNSTQGYFWKLNATAIHAHPNYDYTQIGVADVGIIILDDIAPNGPMAWSQDASAEIAVNATFTAVGFGITSGGGQDSGTKRTTQLTISAIGSDAFQYGDSMHNTCSGDSGGPAIMNIAGVDTVVGLVSYGDQNCAQYGVDMRTDYNAAFISQYANTTVTPVPTPTPPPTPTPAPTSTPDKKGLFGLPNACDVGGLGDPTAGAVVALASLALILRRRRA